MATSSITRFENRVADYVRFRPGYPAGVIDVLRGGLGLVPSAVIADIGAGTGISAGLFLEHGHTVHAVEPNAAMRRAAEASLGANPAFHAVAGTAEATSLPDESVDVVVAAQAFHWFEPAAARTEFRRILRGDKRVALLWNTRRTDGTPFLRGYEALLAEHGTDYAAIRHDRLDHARLHRFFGGPFEYRTLENAQRLDRTALRGRLLSSSYVPAAGEPGHDAMSADLDVLFDATADDGVVEMAYDVEILFGTLQ
jgi:SAM-dependent methyltransferase